MATTPQRPDQIIPQSHTGVHNGDMKHGISLKIKLIQGLTMNNVYTKFEKDPKRIADVRVVTVVRRPVARPDARSWYDNTPLPLGAAG